MNDFPLRSLRFRFKPPVKAWTQKSPLLVSHRFSFEFAPLFIIIYFLSLFQMNHRSSTHSSPWQLPGWETAPEPFFFTSDFMHDLATLWSALHKTLTKWNCWREVRSLVRLTPQHWIFSSGSYVLSEQDNRGNLTRPKLQRSEINCWYFQRRGYGREQNFHSDSEERYLLPC